MNELDANPEMPTPQALMRAYVTCLVRPDARRARVLIEDSLLDGVSAATIYLDVIDPAMREIGRLWEAAQVSVAQEHLATQITQSVIATLGLALSGTTTVGRGRLAVVASSPGERHALGGQMVADFLESQGWTALALGPDTPIADLVGFARVQGPSSSHCQPRCRAICWRSIAPVVCCAGWIRRR